MPLLFLAHRFAAAVAVSSMLLESLSEVVPDSEALTRWVAVYCSALYLSIMGVVGLGKLVVKPPPPAELSAMFRRSGVGVPLPYATCRSCVYLDYNGTSPIFPEVSRYVPNTCLLVCVMQCLKSDRLQQQ
jgi:hypothetical protein